MKRCFLIVSGVGYRDSMINLNEWMFDLNTETSARIERVLSEFGMRYMIPVIGSMFKMNNLFTE